MNTDRAAWLDRLRRLAEDLGFALVREGTVEVDNRLSGLAIVARRAQAPEALAIIEGLRAIPRKRHTDWREQMIRAAADLTQHARILTQ